MYYGKRKKNKQEEIIVSQINVSYQNLETKKNFQTNLFTDFYCSKARNLSLTESIFRKSIFVSLRDKKRIKNKTEIRGEKMSKNAAVDVDRMMR